MAYKLMKTLGDAYPGAAAAAKQLRAVTDEFKKNVPLIRGYIYWSVVLRVFQIAAIGLRRTIVDHPGRHLTLPNNLCFYCCCCCF